MFFTSQKRRQTTRANQARRARFFQPRMEALEQRALLALWVVNTLADTVDSDADVTSLREAVQEANANPGADTINFNVAGTINTTGLVLSDTSGGTLIDGTTAPGYAGAPVVILDGPGTGGATRGLQMVSSNNTARALEFGEFNIGIAVHGAGVTNNLIEKCYLGTDGAAAFANNYGVIVALGAANTSIELNTIAFNTFDGVRLDSTAGSGHTLDRNAIFDNGALGINLVAAGDPASGVTANDPLDADSGVNALQNFPVISSAAAQAFGTEVTFSLHSTPSTNFVLQFFASPTSDPSGFGEGRVYLGDYPVSTNAAGNVADVKIFSAIPVGHVISATATNTSTQSTSEFSAAMAVTGTTTRTWDGGGSTAFWSDPLNWQADLAPAAGDLLIFGPVTPTTSVNDFVPGTAFSGLRFTGGNHSISGNQIDTGDGGTTVLAGSVALDIDFHIDPICPPIVILPNSQLRLTGILSGPGGIHKAGGGTLILAGANTFDGVVHVEEGTLRLEHSLALGSASSGTELMDGVLELEGGINVLGESLIVHPYIEQENLIRSVSGTNTWTGTWHFDPICPPIVTEPGSTLQMTGVLSGGGIHKEGAGTLVLSGANTFDGVVHIEDGALRVTNNLALGSTLAGTEVRGEGVLEMAGGIAVTGESLSIEKTTDGIIAILIGLRSSAGDNSWSGPVSMLLPYLEQDNYTGVAVDAGSLTVSGIIDGTSNTILAKSGPGSLILSGANTYAGVTQVNEGVLSIRNSQALGSSAAGIELFDGTLELVGGINVNGESLVVHPYIEQENLIRSVSGTNTWTGTWHFDPICPPIVTEPGSTLRLTGVLSGGGVHKEGAGILILSGANTFDGPVHVEEGTLRLEHSLALGSASSGTELMDGVLELEGGINVQGESLIVHPYIEQENLIRNVSGSNTWTGTWHFDPICPPIVTEPGSTLRLTGMLSGGGVHKEGAGILILSGANTFDGPVHVEEGTLRLEHSLALGSTTGGTELMGGSLELLGGITVANESLDIVDGTSNTRSITGTNTWTGTWHIDPICPPIVTEPGSTLRLTGVLSGPGGFHKEGAGTLILSGANTYAGVTHVAEGVLSVRSNLALGSTAGNTEVFTGATLGLRDGITVTGEDLVLHATSKLQSSGGSNTWTGTTRLLSDPPIDVDTDSVLELEGEIIGTENLEKLGAGTLIFSGDSPDYTGTLLVTVGTVLVNGEQPNSPVIVNGGSLGGSGVVGPVTFSEESLGGAILQSSPLNPSQTDLVVGGTAGADSIGFLPGATAGTVDVILNGASQGSFSPTGRLIAHGLGGDDDLEAAGSLSLSAWLYGDAGHDRLKGGAGHDFLLGGEGDDLLIGGQGRDLLIGGIGADRIIGNADEDLLIAGFTDFDANDTALAAILAEWTSARSYVKRVANLASGIGSVDRLNGSYFLNSQTVHDDDDADMLTGGAGADWFFADRCRDKVTDG